MTLEEIIKSYKKDFITVKTDYSSDFNKVFQEEKDWLGNLENKTHLILNAERQKLFDSVIQNIKDPLYVFKINDISQLSNFTGTINRIIRVGNRINNFKQGTILDTGTLDLATLFNSIKTSSKFAELEIDLNQKLKGFLPHLFSIIKHSQDPSRYPIFYKYWRNISREVFENVDNYDSLCDFYCTIPPLDRHLNFGCYLGAIGINLAKSISENQIIKAEGDTSYKQIKNNLINIDRYFNLIEGYKKNPSYYLIGSKYGAQANEDIFPEMLANSVVATGFASSLDLRDYFNEDEESIKEYLLEQGEESKSINALKKFLSLKIGDKIAIKADGSPKGEKGFLSIVGLAEVM